MESATAAATMPPAEVHSVPTSDGTEVRLTRYKFGTKGPLVLAPGLRQRRPRVRDRHRAEELGPVPRRARLRRVAARLPRQPGPAVELHASSRSTTSRCATGRPRSTRSAARPARTTVQAMGHCVGGLSLFMAIGGGMQGLRSATFSVARRPPDPHARQPGARLGAAWRRSSRRSAIKGLEHRLRPAGAGTAS